MDQTFTWSISGNLTSNSALGTYSYPAHTAARPHAPTAVGAAVFTCDAAGNMTTGLEGRAIVYHGPSRLGPAAGRGAATVFLPAIDPAATVHVLFTPADSQLPEASR
jgi:hypothetical protein